MQKQLKVQQRKDKIANIKIGLKEMPIMKQIATQVEQKIEKNRTRRASMVVDKELSLSNIMSDSDLDSSQKYPSLFLDKYELGDKIGEGAHGIVKKCFCKSTGKLYAVKTFGLDRQHIIFLKNNFTDIKQLKHKNIIGYQALFFEMKTETCHLVMDYLPYPDLLSVQITSEQQLKELIYQILQALRYIHSQKICHRDIKPENILYDKENNKIILIDFGISKKLMNRGRKREMLTLTGTPYYRAPEMFEGGGYDEMVDMWALGITIHKLMTGVTPFESMYHNETITNIMKEEFTFSKQIEAKYSKGARNLVMRLVRKRKDRLTAVQAMKDMWFRDLNKPEDEFIRSCTFNQTRANLLNQTMSFNNHSFVERNDWNDFSNRKGSEQSQKFQIKQFRSLKQAQWKNEKEGENMIYGCQETQKDPNSLKYVNLKHI